MVFLKIGKLANVSNPNGVNLHAAHNELGIRQGLVSNPNGVNLHKMQRKIENYEKSFKPQRGKFTHQPRRLLAQYPEFQTPTG